MFSESVVYSMLLRGHAPQSEPFRKWVTEEVLPSIRKTGQYDITKSTTPEATQFAEEFSQMRGMIENLTALWS
ncbi:BRO-N domain-containing protein [Pantoea septica]|uniref:BRO-N domain-containing protein n=1 Tax=Pantoea septica TaxID=472695 RepID=UPI0035E400CB